MRLGASFLALEASIRNDSASV